MLRHAGKSQTDVQPTGHNYAGELSRLPIPCTLREFRRSVYRQKWHAGRLPEMSIFVLGAILAAVAARTKKRR